MTRIFAFVLLSTCLAAHLAPAVDPASPQRREWKVGDASREALVYAPASAKEKAAPLLFAFHGHGGTMKAAAHWDFQTLWPEAMCVYMQGLPTPGRLTDPEGKKPGWQHGAGAQGDRDLAFFDAVLASLKSEYRVDDKRIYATGHSNGGGFTYLLWATHGDTFAAVAPSGSAIADPLKVLKPKPCLHIAGDKDPLVKYEWQRACMDAVRTLNGCDSEGKPDGKGLVVYSSKTGTPLVEYVYSGGHKPPADAPAKIAAFFREQVKK